MNFKIGHVILAEFDRTISNEDISRFVSILEHEENTEIPTAGNKPVIDKTAKSVTATMEAFSICVFWNSMLL